MRRNRRYAILAIFLLLPLLVGCPKTAYQASARASAGVASSIATALQVDKDLYAASEMTEDFSREYAEVLKGINFANEQFIVDAQAINKAGGGKEQYLVAAQKVADSLVTLDQDQALHGALRIKDPASRAKMTAAVAAIDAAVQVLVASIQGAK